MGSLGAEIPAGFYGVAETRLPAEGSAARAACLVGAVMQANRVFYAANVVRGWWNFHSQLSILHSLQNSYLLTPHSCLAETLHSISPV